MARFIFNTICLLMFLLFINLVNCNILDCPGCCPILPKKCDAICIEEGFKKGSCGGLLNDECVCSE